MYYLTSPAYPKIHWKCHESYYSFANRAFRIAFAISKDEWVDSQIGFSVSDDTLPCSATEGNRKQWNIFSKSAWFLRDIRLTIESVEIWYWDGDDHFEVVFYVKTIDRLFDK